MNLIIVVILLLLLFGGGGYYGLTAGGPYLGGGIGLIGVIILVIWLVGGLR